MTINETSESRTGARHRIRRSRHASESFDGNLSPPSPQVDMVHPAQSRSPCRHGLDVPPATTSHRLTMILAVALPFAGVLFAIMLLWQFGWMGWPYLAMLILGHAITGLGITVGFHRLLTHRSFETFGWIRVFWMVLGSMSVQGSPLTWCAIHRRHHGCSDQHGDPHSPNLHGGGWRGLLQGLWHGQVGWLFTGVWCMPDYERYIPDLTRDKWIRLVDRCFFLLMITSLLIPAALGYWIQGGWFGALLGFLWGGLVRVFITHHITWSINSICHVFGRRPFASGDHSTNNLVCAILGFGEGWHNNHHAFPTSARHGLRWWQLDASWWVIRGMKMCGLAWNIKIPSTQAIEAKRRVA